LAFSGILLISAFKRKEGALKGLVRKRNEVPQRSLTLMAREKKVQKTGSIDLLWLRDLNSL
jgi:hypothetical protein